MNAPCTPQFINTASCELLRDSIAWIVEDSCASDIETVQLYYQSGGAENYILLATIPVSAGFYVYTNSTSVSGCYYFNVTDSTGNISDNSDTLCVDPCPLYELPNIFTPDGNGINDLFHPILPYRDVKDIDIKFIIVGAH